MDFTACEEAEQVGRTSCFTASDLHLAVSVACSAGVRLSRAARMWEEATSASLLSSKWHGIFTS